MDTDPDDGTDLERGHPPGSIQEEEARVTHLRASMARMVRTAASTALDLQTWTELVASLDPEARALAEADQTLPDWVPVEAVMAWVAAFGRYSAQTTRGISLADQLLDHAHPWIQRALDPSLAVEAMPRIFQHYHRGGVARLEEVVPGRALLDLWAFVPFPGWHDVFIPSIFLRALQRCGATDVGVRLLPVAKTDPPFHHRYEMTWSTPVQD
ncbi:MAG TPA: hypothetical protein VJ600_07110 [Holophagaceae bacterium]|nr:hypothetical protein [Holophagaceae bacterium]